MISKKKLELFKKQIMQACNDCDSSGCSTCVYKIRRMTKYADAGIPKKYWSLAFKDFAGDRNFGKLIKEKLSNIDDFYLEGDSLAFIGNLGTGKTYAACCMLKTALVSGYSGKYVQMADVVNSILSGSIDSKIYLDGLMNVDFLIVDEFDPRWVFPSPKVERMFGSTFEYILRTRFQNEMPTIICSNANDIDDVLSSDFAEAFSSLRSMYMKEILVSGRDFRKNVAN